jgi:hypothetical protein
VKLLEDISESLGWTYVEVTCLSSDYAVIGLLVIRDRYIPIYLLLPRSLVLRPLVLLTAILLIPVGWSRRRLMLKDSYIHPPIFLGSGEPESDVVVHSAA